MTHEFLRTTRRDTPGLHPARSWSGTTGRGAVMSDTSQLNQTQVYYPGNIGVYLTNLKKLGDG